MNHKESPSSSDIFYPPHQPVLHVYVTEQKGFDGVTEHNPNHREGKPTLRKRVSAKTDVRS